MKLLYPELKAYSTQEKLNQCIFGNGAYKESKNMPGLFFRMDDNNYRYDPVTLLIIAGAGLGAAGQIQSGRAAAAEGKSAQNIANYNAAVMEQQAKTERLRGGFEQVRQAKRGERVKSSMQAALGAAGGLGAGSSLLLESEQAAELELENLMIGYESELAAGRAESQATLDRLQGKLYRQKGRNLATASYIGAGSTLLTGLGMAGYLMGTPKTPVEKSVIAVKGMPAGRYGMGW